MNKDVIHRWKEIVENADAGALELVLADDVVFHSPVVHTPQRSKLLTSRYLNAALQVLSHDTFRHVGDWRTHRSAVLEFAVVIEG